jgi:hypothetical protein
MAQIGEGFTIPGWPSIIDTAQTWVNGNGAMPDSNSRLDAEAFNDFALLLRTLEVTLGTNPQGAFGSVAARLSALESGGSALTNVVAFTGQTSVSVSGAAHQQGQLALLYQVYDASTPRQALAPDSFSVFPGSYDAVVTFEVPQSGVVMVAALTPQYVTTFTTSGTPPSVIIPGSTHGLTQTYLFFQAYGPGTPAPAINVSSLRVNPTTKDVTVLFEAPITGGTLVLSVGTPRFAQAFTSQTTVTVLGSAHGLASPHLLYNVYDTSAEPEIIQPGGVTVHPTTFDVALTFAAPQSGTLVLAPVPSVTPPVLLAVLPMTRAVPVVIATRQAPITPELEVATLRTTVATLETRLQTMESAYQTLLTQRSGPSLEDPPA